MASTTWVSADGGASDSQPNLSGRKLVSIEADNGVNPIALNGLISAAQQAILQDSTIVVKILVGSE